MLNAIETKSKRIEMNRIEWLRVRLDWIHIFIVAVRGKWRMQMAELSKAIKETRRARRRPPKCDLKSFSSFMTRSRLGIINQSMEICIRFIWYIWHDIPYIYDICTYMGYIHIGQHTLQSYREARLEIAF